MEQNSPQLWNKLWRDNVAPKEDILNLLREENSIRWQRIKKNIVEHFGSLEGLNVMELGAGAGTNAALMARGGAHVTVLDYSEESLIRAKEFFTRNGVQAEYVNCDALKLRSDLLSRFDVAMSFGLSEHFRGGDRVIINKAHLDVVRPGGMVFISVPNKFNAPYRIYKFFSERLGWWRVGEEIPYSRKELRDICKMLQVENYRFFGDSLFYSLEFINPVKII